MQLTSNIVTEAMHAIGSSYLIRQAARAERFSGVTVKIRPRAESIGRERSPAATHSVRIVELLNEHDPFQMDTLS
jgi:hypothetical protein